MVRKWLLVLTTVNFINLAYAYPPFLQSQDLSAGKRISQDSSEPEINGVGGYYWFLMENKKDDNNQSNFIFLSDDDWKEVDLDQTTDLKDTLNYWIIEDDPEQKGYLIFELNKIN